MNGKKSQSYSVENSGQQLPTLQDVDEPEVDTRCGFGSCKPEVLQKCNNPKVLLAIMCILTVSQGFAVNGINNVNTQSIERRFRLPSSRSGLISSSYDFSAALVGIFVSFLGSGYHKARWQVVAAISLGLGSFTMALPHFTTGLYNWGQTGDFRTCQNGTVADEVCEDSDLSNYLGVLMFGMILHGVGGCILYTIGVGLIDDSVDAVTSPLYLGFLYGAAALGPGLGYVVGGQFLNLYVDFDKVDTSEITLKTDDPRWVGAWWLGFFITMILCLIVALPLSCFGAEMPSAKAVRESRVSQAHKGQTDAENGKGRGTGKRLPIKQFPRVTWSLLRNPPFLFTTLAGASEGILTAGFATFVPKYIQNVFGVSSGAAAIYTGAAAVPGAAGGMFFGGLIANRLKLKVRGMFKFAIITCFISILLVNFLWIKCDEIKFAGVSTPYTENGQSSSLEDQCNNDCSCSTRYYDVVCSNQNVQYFSACHAGCQNEAEDGKSFTNCTCIAPHPETNVSMVTEGPCDTDCSLLYLFLVLFFFSIFVAFLPSTPSDAATLRCINEDHRTFSMGIKWLFIRLLGTVPGPVIFGAVTDTACVIWQTECGEQSSCWLYDTQAVSRNYFLVAIAAKFLSMIFFSLAFCLYKPPEDCPKDEFEPRDSTKQQMSFVNGSFRDSEFEAGVLTESKRVPQADNKTTNL